MTLNKRGVEYRLMAFFLENPDEELLLADVKEKFKCTPAHARKSVEALTSQGLVESVHIVRLKAKGMAK
jgi:DNA-binding IscR family transcriptional regulator